MTDNITEKCYDDFDDIYDEIDSHEKLLEVSSARGLVGRKREIQKELRRQIFTELSGKHVTPDQAPNIDVNFDAQNSGMFRCIWCKRIFKKEMSRLMHSYWCNWQPEKVEGFYISIINY